MQSRGQTTLLREVPKCMCGFHTQKVTMWRCCKYQNIIKITYWINVSRSKVIEADVFFGCLKQATVSTGQAPRVVEQQQSAATGPAQEVMEQSQPQPRLQPQPRPTASVTSRIIPSLSMVITFLLIHVLLIQSSCIYFQV